MHTTRRMIVADIAAALVAIPAGAASADDHLFNGATSQGADDRGFTNPVALNPSGTSGAMARPATVPGLGNPNAGEDQDTPAFNPDTLCVRIDGGAAFCA